MAQPFPRHSKNLKPQQCLGAARARKNERMRCEGADTLASFVLCLRVRVCVVREQSESKECVCLCLCLCVGRGVF